MGMLLFLCYFNCNACTCIGIISVIKEVEASDIIVCGKVISENIFTVKEWRNKKKLEQIEYKISISKIFKGSNSTDTLRIVTGTGSGDCGVKFLVGKKYIIYAQYRNKYFEQGEPVKQFYYTDICTRTQLFNKNEAKEISRCVKRSRRKLGGY